MFSEFRIDIDVLWFILREAYWIAHLFEKTFWSVF